MKKFFLLNVCLFSFFFMFFLIFLLSFFVVFLFLWFNLIFGLYFLNIIVMNIIGGVVKVILIKDM